MAMRAERKRLIDLYPVGTPASAGIFTAMYSIEGHGLEWLTEDTAATLDKLYLRHTSGWKEITELVEYTLGESESMTALAAGELAAELLFLFAEKWKRDYEVVESIYNPLHNYDRVEEHSGIDSTKLTPGITVTDTTKVATDVTNTNNASSDVYGYNSAVGVPSDKSGSTTRTQGTADNNVTENKTEREGFDETALTHGEKITVKGNIGVTTSTAMLREHLDFWGGFNFFERVMADADELLVLAVN